jgi:hypothetical protein
MECVMSAFELTIVLILTVVAGTYVFTQLFRKTTPAYERMSITSSEPAQQNQATELIAGKVAVPPAFVKTPYKPRRPAKPVKRGRGGDAKKRVLEYVAQHNGVTIDDIARDIGITRNTARVYLSARLKGLVRYCEDRLWRTVNMVEPPKTDTAPPESN